MRRRLGAPLLAIVLVLGACGNADDADPADPLDDRVPRASPEDTGVAPDEPDGLFEVTEREVVLSIAAPLPVAVTEVAGAVFDGGIAVIGGLEPGGTVSSRVDVYEPAGDGGVWVQRADLPIPLHHTAAVAFGGRLYVIGGYTVRDGNRWVPSDSVFSLGGDEAAWREEPPLRTARGALAAVATADHILVAGGVDAAGEVLTSTETLSAGAQGWAPGHAMVTRREHFTMTVADGDVFAIAGRSGGLATNVASVEVLRAGAEEWETVESLNRSRSGIGSAVVRGRPCVAGGEEAAGTIGPVECLAPDGTWRIVTELAEPRHGLAVVELGGRVHAIAGGPEPGLTVSDIHEVIEFR